MKKKIRVPALLGTVCLLLMMVGTGCARQNYSIGNMAPTPGTKEFDAWAKENKPLDVSDYVKAQWDKWNIGKNIDLNWYIGLPSHTYLKDWSEYELLNDVKTITGVSPKISVPAGDPVERLNQIITLNEWPDIITLTYGDAMVNKLIDSGHIYTLEELAAQYAPDFITKELPVPLVEDTMYTDGKLYGLPGGYLMPFLCESKDGVGAYTYSVHSEYYEELGSPSIKTLDDFYNTLKAFKAKYPTLNGKPSIPLVMGGNGAEGLNTLRHSFGIKDLYVAPDGSVKSYYFDPKFKELLLFVNKLQREGLIDRDALIKDKNLCDQDLATRAFMCPAYFWFLDAANAALKGAGSDARYISIDPLNHTGTDTVSFPGLTRLGGQITLIPKKARNVEAAFKFLRYMMSEDGNTLMVYGREGEHYTYEEKDSEKWIRRTETVQKEWINDYTGYVERLGMGTMGGYLFLKRYPEIGMEDPNRMKYDRPIANKYSFDNTLFTYDIAPDPKSDEGIAYQQLGDIGSKEMYKVITAESEQAAAAAYDAFIQKAGAVTNLDKASLFTTERYNRNVKKFGGPKY